MPRAPKPALSRKQRKVVLAVAEGKTVAQAKEEAGYGRSTSLRQIFKGDAFRSGMRGLLDRYGYTDKRIIDAFGEALQAKTTKHLKTSVTRTEGGGEEIEYTPVELTDNPVRLKAAEDLAEMRGMLRVPPAVDPGAQGGAPGVRIVIEGQAETGGGTVAAAGVRIRIDAGPAAPGGA